MIVDIQNNLVSMNQFIIYRTFGDVVNFCDRSNIELFFL